MNFNGLALASDERTLPDSLRGYAPVVRGVANTTATVTIKQNGNQIYQKTVSPGAFSITDLYPTSYKGDLDVEITEADGSVRRFSVPFSAVPESLRPGSYRYNFYFGRTRNIGQDSVFADAIYQYGLSNIVKRLNFDHIINMSYSLDFRRKVLAIKKEKGLSIRETAKRFCIGSATVSRWIKQIEPKPAASRSRKIDKSALEKDVRQ